MEEIFRGLEASDQHPDGLKEQILEKLFKSLLVSRRNAEEIEKLLKLFVEWILTCEKKMFVQMGHAQFCAVSDMYPDVFQSVINANFVINVFTNAQHTNKSEIPVLIQNITTICQKHAAQNDEGEKQIERSLLNVAKSHVVRFFKEQGVHYLVAANVAKLYNSHPFLLPSTSECNSLSKYVVKLLAGFPTPDPISKEFIASADELSSLLPLLWNRSESKDKAIQNCLRHFYTLLSSDSYCQPSCALLSFLDVTPRIKLEACFRIIVEEKASGNEAEIVLVLKTMITWLTLRPSTPLAEWLLRILRKLHHLNKISVLVEVSHLTIEKLHGSLLDLQVRDSVELIFFYLLLGFQHSETASFFKIVEKLPETLNKLSKESSAKARRLVERLVESIHLFSELFSNYAKIFEPLLEFVEKFNCPKLTENRLKELKSHGWFSSPQNVESSRLVDVTTVMQCRSETGKIGLVNLGNTCYCNSIIQALFMTTQFYDCVMNAPKCPAQTVLHYLQVTFAHLKHSMRSIFSPAEFVRASRPPWFEAGRQQDCSEFLRYLLDTLHEQERRSNGLTGLSSNPREHHIKQKSGMDDGGDEQNEELMDVNCDSTKVANLVIDSDAVDLECVKPASSTSGLNAITEAPEDEDMMSQGSGVQFENFGSRSSLGVGNTASDSEDDEENILGSRSSLSGLKRWTTEENLSSESRNATIHDFYSNSTDSGIQSVGDSIRGSSDSMSNGTNNGTSNDQDPSEISEQSSASKNSLLSIEQRVFGGKIETTYECSRCATVSIHRESFYDILLPFPSEDETANSPLTMQALLESYLRPERLDGDNKYHCERCSSLEDAVKAVKIFQPPNHLKCTLMRFKYDRETGRKRKILTEVNHNLTLTVPCNGTSGEEKTEQLYTLYAVVVHSGTSSDSGHYFTYARDPMVFDDVTQVENLSDTLEDYNRRSQWYIFNDSTVSFTTFEAFLNMTKRFHSDTAYVLFYQKFSPPEVDDVVPRHPLRTDLQLIVERDNIRFLREKERTSTSFVSSTSSGSFPKPARKDEDSDEDGAGPSGSYRGCGGSDFNAPGRFVC